MSGLCGLWVRQIHPTGLAPPSEEQGAARVGVSGEAESQEKLKNLRRCGTKEASWSCSETTLIPFCLSFHTGRQSVRIYSRLCRVRAERELCVLHRQSGRRDRMLRPGEQGWRRQSEFQFQLLGLEEVNREGTFRSTDHRHRTWLLATDDGAL